jgi:hypothetical protein
MAFRLSSWIGLTAGGCAVAAVALLPPEPAREPWAWVRPMRPAEQVARQLRRAYNVHRTLAARDAVMRELRGTGGATEKRMAVVTGRGVPAPLGDALQRLVQPVSDLLDARRTNTRLAVAVLLDTAGPPANTLGELYYPGTTDTAGPAMSWGVLLPEATDGRTCLVVLSIYRRGLGRLRTSGVPHDTMLLRSYWWPVWDDSFGRSLLGPCGFYAAFGSPGPGVKGWLESADYIPAIHAGWIHGRPGAEPAPVPRPPLSWWRRSWTWRVGFHPLLEACASGQADRCREAVMAPATAAWIYDRPDFAVASQMSPPGVVNVGRLGRAAAHGLGPNGAQYLSDLVRDIGPDRFARFWTSNAPIDQAFEEATGTTIEAWTMRWARRYLGVTPRGPTPTPTTVVISLVVAAAVLAVGAVYTTRRQVG